MGHHHEGKDLDAVELVTKPVALAPKVCNELPTGWGRLSAPLRPWKDAPRGRGARKIGWPISVRGEPAA